MEALSFISALTVPAVVRKRTTAVRRVAVSPRARRTTTALRAVAQQKIAASALGVTTLGALRNAALVTTTMMIKMAAT